MTRPRVLAVLLFLPALAAPRLAAVADQTPVTTARPPAGAAQKTAFIDAFIEFHSALSGTYGDEGPRVEAALDRMAVALEAWNSETRAAEAAWRSRPAGTTSSLAQFFLEAGRPAEALKAVDADIRLEPGRATLHRLRGELLAAAGRDTDALAAFQRAWALDPADPVNAYRLADSLSADPLSEPPEPQLAALLAAPPPAVGASTRPFDQVALIDDGASEEPRFSRSAYTDGVAAFANGRYADAIGLFGAAMAGDPLVADHVARSGRAAQGVAALREGRFTDAVADLEAAVAAAPSSSEARRLLGAAYAAAGNVDASVMSLEDAIRLAPADERARVAMGRVLMEAGRIGEAERVLLDTIRTLPAAGRARWVLADLLEKTGRGIEAVDQLEQAATLTVIAGKAGLLWRLANLAHHLQDEERVVSALRQLTRLMPNDPFAHKSLGLAYHRTGRDVRALVELLVSSRLGTADAETLAVMGTIHLNAGRLTIAETVLRRAVAMTPDSLEARYALARTLLRVGKTQEGQEQLSEFRRLQARALDERRQKYESELLERTRRLDQETAK